jgi:hypothetical protein
MEGLQQSSQLALYLNVELEIRSDSRSDGNLGHLDGNAVRTIRLSKALLVTWCKSLVWTEIRSNADYSPLKL